MRLEMAAPLCFPLCAAAPSASFIIIGLGCLGLNFGVSSLLWSKTLSTQSKDFKIQEIQLLLNNLNDIANVEIEKSQVNNESYCLGANNDSNRKL